MVFVADDLGAWLVGALAEAGRRRLTTLVLGSDQERALRQAATAALQFTAAELRPEGGKRASELAMVVSQVFGAPLPDALLTVQATLLEALQAGIADQLAVLGDPGLTGTGQSSADVLGVRAETLAEKLTSHLVQEIVVRGSRGGPLAPLAGQLNHDVTHLQLQQLEGTVGRLVEELRDAFAPLDISPPAPVALAQLPPLAAEFTGRESDLAVMMGLLDPAGAGGTVVVSAVAGLPGVGKTELAAQAGYAAWNRGWFGGVLFIDLHGYDAPIKPKQALYKFLRDLGVPAEQIPPRAEQQVGLYRSELAKVSKPVLVIADNASEEGQVWPLLPGPGPHRVVVTSRETLGGLDARLLDLTVLDTDAGVALLDAALQTSRPDDKRISGDPKAARRLAEICGGLPLALQIVGALLKAHPTLRAGSLADELSDEKARLEVLRYGSGPGALSVEAAFELSYRRLEEAAARVFRLLPVNPGPDLSTSAVTVLAGLPAGQVPRVLRDLDSAHLIESAPGAQDRWRLHDLLRLYAQQLSDNDPDADGRERARDRLSRYYLDKARAADEHLQALPYESVSAEFASRDSAVAWLDAERPNLVAAVRMAANTGPPEIARDLPLALGQFFYSRRLFDDWRATLDTSLKIARRRGDQNEESKALTKLGWALIEVRQFEKAIAACHAAVAIFRELPDRQGEGEALNNLGIALRQVNRLEEAISTSQDAAAIFREAPDPRGEGIALTNIGLALGSVGRLEEAITAHEDAAAICRSIGDRHEEAAALTNLGSALQQAGRLEEAITTCQDAVAIYRQTGDRHGEGTALGRLGLALQEVGRSEEAITASQEAAAIFRETRDRHEEAAALTNLGSALQQAGRLEEAITTCQDAVAIYRQTGDRHGEGTALGRLGLALQEVGRSEEAITASQEAAAICRETRDHERERIELDALEAARAAQQT